MMTSKSMIGALLAASMLTMPALAQQTGRDPATEAARGYVGVPSPQEPAVDAQEKPVTQALNNQVAQTNANAQAVNSANAAISVANQAQYDADRTAYMDALVRHDAQVDRRDARWARQQTAYADAMAVWRVQVDQCKKGRQKACDMPSPNPADYY